MDQRLISWARAVKRRRRTGLPVVWLFTDEARQPDPLPSIAALPPGLAGVVFRHDGAANRAALAARAAALCRAKNLALVVAGDKRLAARLHAGLHLRGGRPPGLAGYRPKLITASAHTVPELLRAKRNRACILFISPAFATLSHPAAATLGPVRWRLLARHATPALAYALGGISAPKINELAGFCYGFGAIHALNRHNSS